MRLNVQHRMRLEVARLIAPSIYPLLKNHESVRAHPCVPGMGRNVFFYHHTYPEEGSGTSFRNPREAEMVLGLALYLCCDQVGVKANKITIVAAYAAQVETMNQFIRENSKWKPLNNIVITPIDNFQVIIILLLSI